MTKIYFALLSIIIFGSCSDKKDLIGKWEDNIKLSTRSVEFEANADSTIITTEGDWWWINGINFEGIVYQYYGSNDVNLESDKYIITEEEFEVERRDKNTLFVKINKNNSGVERWMRISFEAGDYFDYVNIKQKAE